MIQKIDKQHVQEAVQEAYERFKGVNEGKNADYIPYLANVPANLFGIAACLPDGEVIAVGDTDYKFGIESVSKVPTAILAMNLLYAWLVWRLGGNRRKKRNVGLLFRN